MKGLAAFVGISLLLPFSGLGEPADKGLELISVRKIWDRANHNAFTDLTRYQGKWFCVFREGNGHVSPKGKIRVLRSSHGTNWESVALLAYPKGDLRDPKITVTPEGELMLTSVCRFPKDAPQRHQTLAWGSSNGEQWGEATPIGEPDFWLWRVTWHRGKAYTFGYHTVDPRLIRLYRSKDGKAFETWVARAFTEQYPSEAALLFREDQGLCLLRRDGTAQLGEAKPPYRDWHWSDLGLRIGGPDLLELPDGRIIAGARLYRGGVKTALLWLNPDTKRLEKALELPSGGDTSYPGLMWHDGRIWMSYYSSHEGKTSIYLARIALSKP